MEPVIKVFEDDAQETCYLYYVDRYCISDANPYEITFDPGDLPGSADCSPWLLDHSRRFIMEGTWDGHDSLYTFLDTLDAGEGRLCELVDPRNPLPADLRITSPDIWMISGTDTTTDMRATVNDSVTICADFYNLGTVARSNVTATLHDSTGTGTQIGTDNIAFSGLGYTPDSLCRRTDMQTASFGWRPDSLDIGVHRMTVSVPSGIGEPNTDDNSVDFVFQVQPRDYATAVLDDPWDMDDSTSSHAWNTDDIEAVSLNWDTTSTGWTDSVSGMFEGVIEYDSGIDPEFQAAFSLAIPEDSLIDSDLYHMLSLGICVNNPNATGNLACRLYVGWMESDNSWHDYVQFTDGTNYYVLDGWNEYSTVGPVDLSTIQNLNWGGEDATELWIKLEAEKPELWIPMPMDIRIGWVMLEESLQ